MYNKKIINQSYARNCKHQRFIPLGITTKYCNSMPQDNWHICIYTCSKRWQCFDKTKFDWDCYLFFLVSGICDLRFGSIHHPQPTYDPNIQICHQYRAISLTSICDRIYVWGKFGLNRSLWWILHVQVVEIK